MAEVLELKVNKESYMNRIAILDAQLNNLYNLMDRYKALKQRVRGFMEEQDDSFVQMQENVEQNIQAVQNAINLTTGSLKTLKKMVDYLETTESNIGNIISDSTEIVKNTISDAIDVGKVAAIAASL